MGSGGGGAHGLGSGHQVVDVLPREGVVFPPSTLSLTSERQAKSQVNGVMVDIFDWKPNRLQLVLCRNTSKNPFGSLP